MLLKSELCSCSVKQTKRLLPRRSAAKHEANIPHAMGAACSHLFFTIQSSLQSSVHCALSMSLRRDLPPCYRGVCVWHSVGFASVTLHATSAVDFTLEQLGVCIWEVANTELIISRQLAQTWHFAEFVSINRWGPVTDPSATWIIRDHS